MTDSIAPQLEVLIRRRLEILAQLDAAGEALAAIDAAILTLCQPGDKLVIDDQPVFHITQSHKWNEAKAREILPPELIDALTVTETVTKLDAARAKDVLPPALYKACTKESKKSVAKVAGR